MQNIPLSVLLLVLCLFGEESAMFSIYQVQMHVYEVCLFQINVFIPLDNLPLS